MQKKIESYCKATSKRKLQKNATPIREAVVLIKPDHTMEDLVDLADKIKDEFGIECFQIHIHRDEGKSRDDLNFHAHMVFRWQDMETGKTMRVNKLGMSQLQTLVANALGMERGKLKENSNRERLEPTEYKRQQEELRQKELQEQNDILEQKKMKSELELQNLLKEETKLIDERSQKKQGTNQSTSKSALSGQKVTLLTQLVTLKAEFMKLMNKFRNNPKIISPKAKNHNIDKSI